MHLTSEAISVNGGESVRRLREFVFEVAERIEEVPGAQQGQTRPREREPNQWKELTKKPPSLL